PVPARHDDDRPQRIDRVQPSERRGGPVMVLERGLVTRQPRDFLEPLPEKPPIPPDPDEGSRPFPQRAPQTPPMAPHPSNRVDRVHRPQRRIPPPAAVVESRMARDHAELLHDPLPEKPPMLIRPARRP